jgi:hypothetical protein
MFCGTSGELHRRLERYAPVAATVARRPRCRQLAPSVRLTLTHGGCYRWSVIEIEQTISNGDEARRATLSGAFAAAWYNFPNAG